MAKEKSKLSEPEKDKKPKAESPKAESPKAESPKAEVTKAEVTKAEESPKRPSIEGLLKGNPQMSKVDLNKMGYSDSEVGRFIERRTMRRTAEKKAAQNIRGKKVSALAAQLRRAGITNFETKKGQNMDISDIRKLLSKKSKSPTFRDLLSKIVTSAGRHIKAAVGTVKQEVSSYIPKKKKNAKPKEKTKMLGVPPGFKKKNDSEKKP